MKDYIEREEVKKEIIEWASILTNPKFLDRDATLDIIRLIPSADVAKIRHGKWIDIMFVKADDPDGGYWISRCSECDIPNYKHTNYCPNCGARMEEVRKK